MPEISVIVPVYKVEDYLRRCVDSILNQTYRDFELILVDDGSPDDCGAICDEYAAGDSRVVALHRENGGLSAARNTGLDWAFAHSDSRWLTFIDSDDWVHPQYLERLHQAATTYSLELVACKYQNVEEFIPEYPRMEGEVHPELCTMEQFDQLGEAACIKIYAKELFHDVRFPVGRLHEDVFVTYQVAYFAKKKGVLPETLYYYYLRPGSITNTVMTPKRMTDIMDAMNQRVAFYREYGEKKLEEQTEKDTILTQAKFVVQMLASGPKKQIPEQYRMSQLAAYREIYRQTPYEMFSWYLSLRHPRLVRPYAYWRKFKKMLGIRCP